MRACSCVLLVRVRLCATFELWLRLWFLTCCFCLDSLLYFLVVQLFFHKEQALLEAAKQSVLETLKKFEGTLLLKTAANGGGIAAMQQQTLNFLGR